MDNNHGGKRVLILAEDDNNEISGDTFHKYAHGAKEMQLELSRKLFYCDDVKGFFEKYRNIGDGICGIKMLKQKMKEINWKYQQKFREDEQKPLKTLWINSSCEAKEKITVRKTN